MYVDIAALTKSPPRRYEGDRTPEIQTVVPYGTIFQVDEINDDFATNDMVLVIGATDGVHPQAGQAYGDARAVLVKRLEAVRCLGATAA